jgi:hypothetical protein
MRLTTDQTNSQPTPGEPTINPTNQRVTVADASLLLGISEDAVRSRLRRGTLRRDTGTDGTVFVVLGTDRPTTNKRLTDDRPGDQPSTDQVTDNKNPAGDPYRDELLDVLRNDVFHLRDQLDRERDASAELRRIVAGLVQRVPELEATPGTRDAPETASQRPAKAEVAQEPEKPSERRSWLYRFFFGP